MNVLNADGQRMLAAVAPEDAAYLGEVRHFIIRQCGPTAAHMPSKVGWSPQRTHDYHAVSIRRLARSPAVGTVSRGPEGASYPFNTEGPACYDRGRCLSHERDGRTGPFLYSERTAIQRGSPGDAVWRE